jgi:hypothetical protein
MSDQETDEPAPTEPQAEPPRCPCCQGTWIDHRDAVPHCVTCGTPIKGTDAGPCCG